MKLGIIDERLKVDYYCIGLKVESINYSVGFFILFLSFCPFKLRFSTLRLSSFYPNPTKIQ